jgi:DNA topoisomerase-1
MKPPVIKISRRKLKALVNDSPGSAAAINLVYVNDTQQGITRERKGETFIYRLGNKEIKNKAELERIRRLVIPPAWEQVWICTLPNGHLQVTGLDMRKRKQYRYHPLWNVLRNQAKFSHLHEFGKALPAMRARLEHDLSLPGLPAEKVLAAVVSVMEHTSLRVGNNMYEKLYGSFGLTTLKNRHVQINGNSVRFAFKGKKGVYQDVQLKSRRLARIVKQCRDIPGKELFQYYDANGGTHTIDSGMVNNYIKEISGGNFTAKDFRTWSGTLHALEAFKAIGAAETATAIKKNIVSALDMVAGHLGNTRTVCRKYYVHPTILDLYTNKLLHKCREDFEAKNLQSEPNALLPDEQLLMHILEKHSGVLIL